MSQSAYGAAADSMCVRWSRQETGGSQVLHSFPLKMYSLCRTKTIQESKFSVAIIWVWAAQNEAAVEMVDDHDISAGHVVAVQNEAAVEMVDDLHISAGHVAAVQ